MVSGLLVSSAAFGGRSATPFRAVVTPDLSVSPEFAVADTATRAATGGQGAPSVAFDGTNHLVVWTDTRSGQEDIYGARVTPDGTVLDRGGIAISTAADYQSSPRVAFDGENYLVVWTDARRGQNDTGIFGARVSPAGAVLDPSGIPISTAQFNQELPVLAFDGDNYLIAWSDTRDHPQGAPDAYAARMTPTGAVLDPNGFAVSTAVNGQYPTGLAFDGTNYLVVWTDGRAGSDVYGARVTPGGGVLDPGGIPISTAAGGQYSSGIAFDGTNYVVAWDDGRSGFPNIYAARLSQDGVVLDPSGIPISTSPDTKGTPRVAFDGTNYLFAWEDSRGATWDLYGARMTPTGSVLDSAGIPISTEPNVQWFPAVDFDGANYLVVWQDDRSDPNNVHIYGARVSPAGTVLEPSGILLSTMQASQISPAVAFDGTNYLVAWEDDRGGSPSIGETRNDIYAARVSRAGTFLDGTGIQIAAQASLQTRPAVAFDGVNFLIVWSDYRRPYQSDIYGARVTPAGVVLDPGGFPISEAPGYQFVPKLAFDGTNYLVVWDDAGSDLDGDVYAARVAPSGVVLDPAGIPVATGSGAQGSSAVAFGGGNFFVAWSDDRALHYVGDVYGTRVTPGGTVLDPNGIPISTASGGQYPSSVAFDGANYLVAWGDDRSGSFDAYGARVSLAGVVLDPGGIPVSTAPGDQEVPVAVFSGPRWLLAWSDSRNGGLDLYGARVDATGGVLDPDGFGISVESGDESWPAAVTASAQQVGVAYDRVVASTSAGDIRRAFLRFVDPSAAQPPPPPPGPPPPPPPAPQPPPPPVRCRVPRVIGMRLAAARRRIRAAHCRVGRIRRAHSRRVGRVLGQRPKAGAVRPRGTRVRLVVGRR